MLNQFNLKLRHFHGQDFVTNFFSVQILQSWTTAEIAVYVITTAAPYSEKKNQQYKPTFKLLPCCARQLDSWYLKTTNHRFLKFKDQFQCFIYKHWNYVLVFYFVTWINFAMSQCSKFHHDLSSKKSSIGVRSSSSVRIWPIYS